MAEVKPKVETFARIKVIGVGGGGSNAISRMMAARVKGVDFIAVNTDAQALHNTTIPEKIHIGKNMTRGLGAGMNPEVGRQAAEESREELQQIIKGADMVFITAGMGGGTGTGAASIISEIARESGALTVGVVTKPFAFEGSQRSAIAEQGLLRLRDNVDTLITIPNDKLLDIIDKKTSLLDAFAIVDDILRQAVQGISDLITINGVVNVDFADVKAVMRDAGSALMGIGSAIGEGRAVEAARTAINSPLLEVAIDGAKGVLFNICGGPDLAMSEINEAAKIITESIDSDAKVIFGAVIDNNLKKGELKITVIATGFDSFEMPRDKTIVKDMISNSLQSLDLSRNTSSKLANQEENIKASFEKKEMLSEDEKSESDSLDNSSGAEEESHEDNAEDDKRVFSSRDLKNKDEEDSQDEFEIPAFIRRKVKK